MGSCSSVTGLILVNRFVDLSLARNILLFGFYLGQDYFTHFEPSQSYGGQKTGDPRAKPSDHPQAKLGLSHISPELGQC